MARVVVEHLTKSFSGPRGQRLAAVNGVSFTLEEKELLVLAGPSACGKTTTLRLLAGLEKPDAGTIRIDGRLMNDVPPKERDIAMVFQHPALYPHMTVYENLGFGLKVRRVPRSERDARVRETAELLGLTDCLDRLPAAISGGQRQRVALGRAMVRRPKLFLLDEPLSSLDPPMRLQMRAEIIKLHRQLGATILYVTHDQNEAMTIGQRLAVMKDGAIQQIAEPMELYAHPANLFVGGFIGSPAMNFIPVVLVRDETGLVVNAEASLTQAGTKRLKLSVDKTMFPKLDAFVGNKLVLGLRPEALSVSEPAGAGDLEATVDFIEARGAETYVHLCSRLGNLVARVAGRKDVRVRQQLSVSVDMTEARFFENESGRAVLP